MGNKGTYVLDCEVFPNYFLLAMKEINTGKIITIEQRGFGICKDYRKPLKKFFTENETFGFNSKNFDIPIIFYFSGKHTKQICLLATNMIENQTPGWMTIKNKNISVPSHIKHFDLFDPAPGVKIGLKLYGARMHSKTLKDIPIEPGTVLTEPEMDLIKEYCINDLDTTTELYTNIKDRIDVRRDMVQKYGWEIMSKSDAQIAEVVIKKEIEKIKGDKIYKDTIDLTKRFKYRPFDFIKFKTKQLCLAYEIIKNSEFTLNKNGNVKMPSEMKKLEVKIGKTKYKLGIGGIHSKEKKQCVTPKHNQLLIDKDVASYYPNIILNNRMIPTRLGPAFLRVYKDIVEKRLKAKKEGNKTLNESLKIVINGSFGKLGLKYSVLFAPDLLIGVTITGQLALLMLIEDLELNGINVVSANTDGFVSLLKKSQLKKFETICTNWEINTRFELEASEYKALYSRDVNNYIAVKKDNSVKTKGVFTLGSLIKNPQADISVDAVIKFLTTNKPIETTIHNCKDVKKFLLVRSVTGGATYKDQYLGRVVRWIYSIDGEQISYKKNGNKVAKSDCSRPILQLGQLPSDIDYKRYIDESIDILSTLNIKYEAI